MTFNTILLVARSSTIRIFPDMDATPLLLPFTIGSLSMAEVKKTFPEINRDHDAAGNRRNDCLAGAGLACDAR
ncbi:hypothetical protein RV134_350090 [Roseovarius sp. EC-HK134]|nr:hypothetical protein RV420_400367 [Roseovarius sp. EC-SD190]VVT28142.1 hypothetical protein RV134_350090 [Roseovarius sp. EC-HK134]